MDTKRIKILLLLVAMVFLCFVMPTMVVATDQSLSSFNDPNASSQDTIGYSSSKTQNAIISVLPSRIEASPGDTFTIEIEIDPKGAAEIYGAQYDLYFESDLLRAIEQTPGEFLTQDGVDTFVVVNRINNATGKLEYAESRLGADCGVTTPGTLTAVTFEVIGAAGTSDLKLSNVILANPEAEPVETPVNSGTCIIVTDAPTPAPTYMDITAAEAHQRLKDKELENRLAELNTTEKIIVYCKSGGRSSRASEILVQHDFEGIYNLLGDINAWQQLHLPIVLPASERVYADLPYRIKQYRVPDSINPAVTPKRVVNLNNQYKPYTVKRVKNVSEYYSYPSRIVILSTEEYQART